MSFAQRPRRGGRLPLKGAAVDIGAAAPSDTLFEIVVRGNAARCAATDVATGVEVVVVGPADASEARLKAVAIRKLRLRLARG